MFPTMRGECRPRALIYSRRECIGFLRILSKSGLAGRYSLFPLITGTHAMFPGGYFLIQKWFASALNSALGQIRRAQRFIGMMPWGYLRITTEKMSARYSR